MRVRVRRSKPWLGQPAGCRAAIASGVLCLALAAAFPAGAATLLDVYQQAQSNDPKYRAARADTSANGTQLDQAKAGFLPVVKIDIERSRTLQKIISSNNPVFGEGQTTFPTTNGTLSITQPIFRKDVIERLAQAKGIVRQAELLLLVAEQDLMVRTASVYLQVLAATDGLALATAERVSLVHARDVAREKLKNGLGTITSQHEADARLAVTEARQIEAENKLLDARQALKEIVGTEVTTFQTLRKDYVLAPPQQAGREMWERAALEQNLSLQARREAVFIAQQEVKRQDAGHYPTLDLVMTHNRRDAGSTLFGGGSNVATSDLMLRLNVPLYSGGMQTAVVKEAVYRLQKSEEELEQDRRAVERAARGAYQGVVSGVSLVRALDQSVVSAESVLDAKSTGFTSGIQTMLAVLDAQRDLYAVRRDLAQARYDYLLNVLRLKQATGTLSENDLHLINAALQ
jgi:outer membrane protein